MTIKIIAAVIIIILAFLIATSGGKDSKRKSALVGKSGISLSDITMDAAGTIKLDGKEYKVASAEGAGLIPKNSKVIVKSDAGDKVIVERVKF